MHTLRKPTAIIFLALITACTPALKPAPPIASLSLPDTDQQVTANIIQTITSTIDPDSWAVHGGTGTIQEISGHLIISQTAENQVKIYNLLQQLREANTVQISLETRILIVSNDVLNNDLRFLWQPGAPVILLESAPATAPAATAPFRQVPPTLIDNSTCTVLLFNTNTDAHTMTLNYFPVATIASGQTTFLPPPPRPTPMPPPTLRPAPTPTDALLEAAPFILVSATATHNRKSTILRFALASDRITPAAPPSTGSPFVQPPYAGPAPLPHTMTIPDGRTLLIDAGPVPTDPTPARHLLLLIKPQLIFHREYNEDRFNKDDNRTTTMEAPQMNTNGHN